jgi:hypothetical protein
MARQVQPPPSGRTRVQPPTNNYPQLQALNLPVPLTQAITQSFQVAYSVRDQATANQDAINHLIQYGQHLDRLTTAPTALSPGSLWYETDRSTWVYQVRMDSTTNQLEWFYAGGIVIGIPTANFTDLGLHDAGALDIVSSHIQEWNGTAWVQIL